MKKIIFIHLLLLSIILGGCSDSALNDEAFLDSTVSRSLRTESDTVLKLGYTDYYWLENEKVPLQKIEGKYLITYDCSTTNTLQEKLNIESITLKSIEETWGHNAIVNMNVKNSKDTESSNLKTAIIQVDSVGISSILPYLSSCVPYYITKNGEEISIRNFFYVKLKSNEDLNILKKYSKENGLEVIRKIESLDRWYCVDCSNSLNCNPLEMANQFHECGLFEFSCPSLLGIGRFDAYEINEPLYAAGSLWHLGNNTVSPYLSTRYCQSRSIIAEGSSDVIIAIIDSGVDTNHRDFDSTILPGWDAETETTPNILSLSHGTNVAGFIGAIPNNMQDVAGVAYGTTILPISIRGYENMIISKEEIIANAFDYAVSKGAKVISCSWSYPNQVVVNAVKKALNNGCIVVFSSGNNNGAIDSPANSDSRIIVVGAIDRTGSRASFSNYGNSLDVVAPGDNVYTLHPSNNTTIVSGTSFATPQVAGLAAMILSKYPNSSPTDVMYRIFKTARKINSGVHGYPYSYRHSDSFTTWNNQMGYGLIDFTAALAQDIPYLITIKIKNSATNRAMGAFRVDFYDTSYNQVQNSELDYIFSTLSTGEEYIVRCNLLPGEYIANVVCETDGGIEEEIKFNFVKGGILSFEYTGALDGKTQWEKPTYEIRENILF